MTSVSRFFQANFSATLLQSAVLAIALIVQAPSAYAETLTLACEDAQGPRGTFTIDLDRKTVQSGSSISCTVPLGGGKEIVVPDCNPPGRAEITERHINWKTTGKTVDGAGGIHNSLVEGSIDRLTGSISYSVTPDDSLPWGFSGPCRRATQKF